MTIVGPWTARQLCVGVGYVFPIYKSSQALRRQDPDELLQWITFWTVNALFWVVELVGDTVIGWVPFYYEAKIALLLWLVLPQYNGARVLHEKWLAPTFEKHEEVIDVTILDIKRRASEKVVQVCKDTAAIALRRGSGVVLQGQQYVATQLVQHALGVQQPVAEAETQELRVPAILSFLTSAATTSAAEPVLKPRKSIVPMTTRAEAKEDSADKPVDAKDVVKAKSEVKKEDKQRSDVKSGEPSAASKGLPPTKPRSPRRSPPPPIPSSSTPPQPARNLEKSKELVSHFKKLLVKGFQLKYYPAEGVLKNRTLRLLSAQSRYLAFESSTAEPPGKNKKSVTLFIHNVRRIASIKAGEPGIPASIDDSLAFVLDNGKTTLVFEADSTKTRDLVVAGMRLLVNEHKRQDTVALASMTSILERLTKQRAFDRLVYLLTSKPEHKREVDL